MTLVKSVGPAIKWQVFLPSEVAIHNNSCDCWISFLGKVFNVTPLIHKVGDDSPVVQPLIAFAGKDVSHWFNEETGELQTHVHPITGCVVPFNRHGLIPDVNVDAPHADWTSIKDPWWKSLRYQVGLLTKKARQIRIVHMMVHKTATISVCSEDTIATIAERFSKFNTENRNYIWKYFDKLLDMNKTLDENEIYDEREHFAEIGIEPNYYIPSLWIYYKDDLEHYIELDEDDY